MNKFYFPIFFLLLVSSTEAKPIPASAPYISSLISEALAAHPKLEAARARSQAARDAIAAIPLWEDPSFGIGGKAAEKSMRRDDGDIRASLEQMLPRPGLYRAEKQRASSMQQVRLAEAGVTANELGLAVAEMVLQLALADDLISLQSEEIDWVQTLVGTARERSKNPDSSASEPLRLESELAVLTQEFESAKRERQQMASALNRMLLRPSEAGWPVLSLTETDRKILSASSLRAEMEQRNPRLLAMRHEIEAAQAETETARQKRKPIVSLGLETNAYSGGNLRDTMLMLKLSLPWFNAKSYRAGIAQAESLERAARKDLDAEVLEFSNQLSALMTQAENNSKLAAAYDSEVIPKTTKTLEAVQNAWISSKSTLLEVLTSRRELLTAKMAAKRALAARQAALQQLSAISGSVAKFKENNQP